MADIGAALELNNLNILMGMAGIFIGICELRFYTIALAYSVKFGPSGAFNIDKFNRFIGSWEAMMFSGTMGQSTDTLNQFSPFLSLEDIMIYWGGFQIPPANVSL